jgi:hypothetical protein
MMEMEDAVVVMDSDEDCVECAPAEGHADLRFDLEARGTNCSEARTTGEHEGVGAKGGLQISAQIWRG